MTELLTERWCDGNTACPGTGSSACHHAMIGGPDSLQQTHPELSHHASASCGPEPSVYTMDFGCRPVKENEHLVNPAVSFVDIFCYCMCCIACSPALFLRRNRPIPSFHIPYVAPLPCIHTATLQAAKAEIPEKEFPCSELSLVDEESTKNFNPAWLQLLKSAILREGLLLLWHCGCGLLVAGWELSSTDLRDAFSRTFSNNGHIFPSTCGSGLGWAEGLSLSAEGRGGECVSKATAKGNWQCIHWLVRPYHVLCPPLHPSPCWRPCGNLCAHLPPPTLPPSWSLTRTPLCLCRFAPLFRIDAIEEANISLHFIAVFANPLAGAPRHYK